jgi:hypothetical protein
MTLLRADVEQYGSVVPLRTVPEELHQLFVLRRRLVECFVL